MKLHPTFLSLCTLTLLYPLPTSAACECGYQLMQTGQRFTHRFIEDFTSTPDTTDATNLTRTIPDWGIQEYNFTADNRTGLIGRQNAMSSIWVRDGQLHLIQQGYPTNGTGPVRVAELQSRRDDFFHGSFRARYRVVEVQGSTGGAVAGFFFYYDDNNETDIEVLTKDNETTIHYTNHPTYDTSTNSLIQGATFADQLTQPWSKSQEHRFDWIEGLTTFYQNNSPKRNITMNVPTHGGKMILNVWANNGSWSGPPSTNDVYMHVEYIVMYFNTTSSGTGNDAGFSRNCESAGGVDLRGTICYITDEEGGSSLDSPMSLDPPMSLGPPMSSDAPATGAGERGKSLSTWLVGVVAGAVMAIM